MTLLAENKAVIRAVFEALDADRLGMLDDHPGYWQTREVIPMLKGAFPDLRHEIKEQIAEGDLVATFSIVDYRRLRPRWTAGHRPAITD